MKNPHKMIELDENLLLLLKSASVYMFILIIRVSYSTMEIL